ncbi:CvpA family protein [Methylohalobius crimeensis]|uniref:CvpA family protein n=1 Tax=Methylohalobius crimeensis TaxID=244365 RepID=UPI0003B6B653|nr:CvpA family protein [Methylohalobius crimeensis]
MIWIDYAILTVICVSALIGLMRGFVQECFSLIGWVAALWVGLHYYAALAGRLEELSIPASARAIVAFAALFIATLILGKVLGYLLGTLIDRSFLSGLNRMGGVLFGGARGLLVVLILVLWASTYQLDREPWWRDSRLLPPLERWAAVFGHFQPQDYLHLVHTR